MSVGWECRTKLFKQIPAKPTVPRGKVAIGVPTPSPAHYDLPELFCGEGFSKIKRSPAYTFGHLTPTTFHKPTAAAMHNIQGFLRTGHYKIKHGIVSPQLEPIENKTKIPGPAAYAPSLKFMCKKPPAFTMRPAARPPYQPYDAWTPSPNMYCPPIPGKKAPVYSLGNMARSENIPNIPGPGAHKPNFNYVKKNKPAYSFGGPFKRLQAPMSPAPNRYCEKKFMVSKRTVPAPSFGIRHSKYRGEETVYLKPEKLHYFSSNE